MEKEAADYVNRIFEKLIVVCPAWKQSADGDPTEWANKYKIQLTAAIKEAGVTKGEQITYGLEQTRKTGNPFLPSPGAFAKYCIGDKKRPGLTHNTEAYRQVDRHDLLPAPKADQGRALTYLMMIKNILAKT